MLIGTILTWIANHIGLGSVKNVTGVRKDIVDTKKANLEIDKLKDEAEKRDSLVSPASFEDVKNYDPKYKAISERILRLEAITQRERVKETIKTVIIGLLIFQQCYEVLWKLIQYVGHLFR